MTLGFSKLHNENAIPNDDTHWMSTSSNLHIMAIFFPANVQCDFNEHS